MLEYGLSGEDRVEDGVEEGEGGGGVSKDVA